MSNIDKILKYLTICFGIAAVIWIYKDLRDRGSFDPTPDNVTIIREDSIMPIEVIINNPSRSPVVTVPVTIPSGIDSAEIARKYFAINYFEQTLIDTDSLKVVVSDSISQNSFLFRKARAEIKFTTTTKEIHEEKKRWGIMAGGFAGYDQRLKIDAALGLKMRNNNTVIVKYDLLSERPIGERFQIGYMKYIGR